jgi:hypothetical protein
LIEGVPKVRRVYWNLVVSAVSLGLAGGALADEQLVMPFACDLEQGRIRVSPSGDRSYSIVGKRDVASVTACKGPRPRDCRAIMAHRFDISCGGAGVAWMRVAAAIRQASAEPAWIEQGRLNMIVPVGHTFAGQAPCMERPSFALGGSGLERRVAYSGDCRMRSADFDHVVLPAGFAPVEELGARVEPAAASDDPTIRLDLGEVSFRPVAVGEGETIILARADPDAIVAPIPGLEPYDPDIEPSLIGDDWVTVVRTEADSGMGARLGEDVAPGPWAWLLAVMALATAVGFLRVRSSYAWADAFAAVAPRLASLRARLGPQAASRWWQQWSGGSASESFINAGAAVKALLAQTESVVARLKGAGPLREVLQSELKLVRQALRSVEAAAKDSGEDEIASATRSAANYRALVRELERIRRIAESAAASLSSARPAGSMPRTTSEAYDVLGVNPDVSEAVLKKIVDALRMSWHPDHARDDEDRRLREDRMRQINIAWELINGAREVA